MQTSSSGEQLLELTTQASGSLSSQQVTTLASILATLTSAAATQLAPNSNNASSIMTTGEPYAASNLLSEQQLNAISEEDELKLLNFPSKREDLSTAIPLTVIFALLLVTGCIGNICTAIVIARPKNKYMHTATNYYLFSLAMSDFLFLILGLPQEMYTLWQRYPYAFGESFCIIRGYLSEASTYASILTISAFTVERYVAICHPLWAHTMSQLPRAITSIVIIWVLAVICAIPPAAELGIVTQKGPLTNRTLEQSAQCATKRTIFENMFVVSAIVFFIVPMIIVTVLYILIAIELRRSSRMNNAISKQTSSQLYSQQSSTTTNHTNNSNSLMNAHHHHHPHSHHRHHHCAQHNHNHHHKHSHHGHSHNHNNHSHIHKHNNNHHNNNHHHHHHHKQHMLPKPRSHQQLVGPLSQLHQQKPVEEKQVAKLQDADMLSDLMISERPQSAIGNEHATTTATANSCCQPPNELCNKVGRHHLKSPTISSLARLQLPAASKLCSQLLGGGFWSGYNLTATSGGQADDADYQATKRPESAFSCQLAIGGGCGNGNEGSGSNSDTGNGLVDDSELAKLQEETPAGQPPTQRHHTLSRQHSPLSYHESLIQRGGHHHSAFDMSPHSAAVATACNNCHRAGPLSHHQPPHHQLSLTQLPTNQQQQQRQLLLMNHHHQHNFKTFQANNNQQHSRRSNAASSKKSVIRMLVAVVVSFFICWVPFHAQRLLASYLVKDENQNQLLLDIYLKLTYISGVMYYLSSTINPLLYQLMSAKFRLAFKETFKCSLFKCAIFRRASTATNATATIGLNHSPTNSIRNEPHHHHHHSHHLQHTCANPCSGQLISARAKFICDPASRTASPSVLAQRNTNNPGGSRTDLATAANPSTDQTESQAQQPALANGSCCCRQYCSCCCCQAALYQHQSAPLATSVLGRFRGQLNASLTSLLRFSLLSGEQHRGNRSANGRRLNQVGGGGSDSHANNHCGCCSPPVLVASQSSCPMEGDKSLLKGTGSANTTRNDRQRQLLLESSHHKHATDSRSCSSLNGCGGQPLVAAVATTTIDADATIQMSSTSQQLQADGPASCVSLDEQEQQRRHRKRADHSIKSATDGSAAAAGGLQIGQVPNLQTSFPAHHTMLKFIRSPTPTSLNGGQPLPSLTRLSSREEDDDGGGSATIDIGVCATQQTPNGRQHLAPLESANNNDRMETLIRATGKDNDDEFGLPDGHDESDPLVSATITSGDSSNEASGTQSSVGSSPDQLGSMSQSTNQTRAMSSSSSSSLALLVNNNCDTTSTRLAASNGSNLQAKPAKRKLIATSSLAAGQAANLNPNSNSRHHQRRASWQQNQTPTCRLNSTQADITCQVLIEPQIDQNGNDEHGAPNRLDQHHLSSFLSSSEMKLNPTRDQAS